MWWKALATTSMALTVAIRAIILINNIQRLRRNVRMERAQKARPTYKPSHRHNFQSSHRDEIIDVIPEETWDYEDFGPRF